MIREMYKWDYTMFLWWASRQPECPMAGCKAFIKEIHVCLDDLNSVETSCPRCKTKFRCVIPPSKRGIVISLENGIEEMP